jgi:hypothetical protein
MKRFVFPVILISSSVFAEVPSGTLIPQKFTILDGSPLLAIHHETYDDPLRKSALALDRYIEKFRRKGNRIIFLVSQEKSHEPLGVWVGQRKDADEIRYSQGGEHPFVPRSGEITVTGGFAESCHFRGVVDVVYNHFQVSNQVLKIHQPMNAIYAAYGEEGGGSMLLDRLEEKRGAGFVFRYLYGVRPEEGLSRFEALLKIRHPDLLPASLSLEYHLDGEFKERIGSGKNIVQLYYWTQEPNFLKVGTIDLNRNPRVPAKQSGHSRK